MSETDNPYYGLASHDNEFAAAWDSYDRIPEPGDNAALDSFVAAKRLDHASLVRLGARMSAPNIIAFGFDKGIKFRDVVTGHKWSMPGSEFDTLKIVPGQDRVRAIICEGETDACRLSILYDCDVAMMPAGAMNWQPTYTPQVEHYEVLMVGLDNDTAGENGWAKIKEALPSSVRFGPPEGCGDWCDLDTSLVSLPELATEGDAPPSLLVSARDLLALEVPEVQSYFDNAILPIGGTAMLHGTFKSFKTWMALALASALAQGEPWAGFEHTADVARVAYLNFEVPWSYYQERVRRFADAARDRELFLSNYFGYQPLTRPHLVAGDKASEDRVLRVLIEGSIQVVFIDPIRRAMGFANMNDEHEVRRILHFAERLTGEGMSVVLLHHDNKEADKYGGGDPAGMTGSGGFAGDADTLISIERPKHVPREDSRRNVHFLPRNRPAPPPVGFRLTEDARVEWVSETWVEDIEPRKEGEISLGD